MCLKKRLGVYLKKSIIVVFTFAVACSLGFCSVSALDTSIRIDIFSPNAITSGSGSVDVIIFAKDTTDVDYGVPLYLNNYVVSNDKMTGYSSLYQTSSVTSSYDIKLVYGLDYWGDYQIDPSAVYTIFYFCSVTGLTYDHTGSSATITIGNISIPSVSTGKNSNNTRWFNFEGKFKGSDLLKNSSNNGYFSFTFSALNVKGNSSFSYYLSSYFTITDIQTQADQVLGGLNSTFGEDYNQPDSGAYDQFHENEDSLIQDSQQYFQDYANRWNDVSFMIGTYFNDFIGFQQLFNAFLNIPQLNFLATISICLGAFGLLLGTVSIVMRRS